MSRERPASASRAALRSLIALLCCLSGVPTTRAASFVDPRLTFQQASTPHFTIYFQPSTVGQARQLAVIAEQVWQQMASRLALDPPPHTYVLLVDQTDTANGSATPVPYNMVVITAAAPTAVDQIGRTDDWLRLVFTHEFTHILHLSQSRGWARGLRALFGRTPLAFPNLFLPTWQIEGFATFEESALTGQGRLHAADFRAIERESARAGRFPPLDRVNGGVTDWPGGAAPYAFGLGLHDYLARRYGEQQLGTLARATSGRFPYLQSPSFKRVYGRSLGDLWQDYQRDLEQQRPPGSTVDLPLATPARLTRHGFIVAGPRFTRDGRILYSMRDADGFPSLQAFDLRSGRSEPVASRYLGSSAAVSGSIVVFDQQEVRRSAGLYSDLYALDLPTGRVQALTRESRLQDPDISPDGSRLAAVREHAGQRDLVLIRLSAPIGSTRELNIGDGAMVVLGADAETHYNAPRFSPDGRRLAVQRGRPGALSEIVVFDIESGSSAVIASDPRARIVTPAWRPDGRAIVAAADYGEQPFQLFEYVVEAPGAAPRRLTDLPGGATWPDVSSDGTTIAFAGYTVDGFDLFRMAYPRAADPSSEDTREPFTDSRVDGRVDGRAAGAGRQPEPGPFASPGGSYSPLRSLRPTSWFPVIERVDEVWRGGAEIGGADVLRRHAYAVSVSWLLEAPPAPIDFNRATPDWTAAYAYSRWWPTFFLSAAERTRFAQGLPDPLGRPTAATRRELEVETGVVQPLTHVRASHQAFASYRMSTNHDVTADREQQFTLGAARLGWASRTAHVFGYSISPERGIAAGATAELARRALGSDAEATTTTADLRAYLPAFAVHDVFAIRVAGGRSTGEPGATRLFHMGGAIPAGDVIDFDQDAFSLMRGFPADAFAGTRAALLNAEYRFPLARPQRGAGTLPLLLHTLHAAAFADVGHAWTGRFDAADAKLSLGAELSADVVAGYAVPLTIAAGGAWARDGAAAQRGRMAPDATGAAFYVRVGRTF